MRIRIRKGQIMGIRRQIRRRIRIRIRIRKDKLRRKRT
jgi:hypothetical protein